MHPLSEKARSLRPALAPTLFRSVMPLVVGLGLALVMQMLVKPHIGDYPAKLVLDIGIAISLAVSLTMVNGFTGQFSMGHAGFLAVGGYAAGVVTYYGSLRIWGDRLTHGGILSGRPMSVDAATLSWIASGDLLFLGALLVGGLVAAILGFLVGLPSLRLRGDYLAIVTLGFGEIVRVLIQQTEATLKPEMVEWELVHPGVPKPAGVERVLSYGFDVIDPILNVNTRVYQAIADTPPWDVTTHVGGALGFTGLPKYTSLFWVYAVAAVTIFVAYRLKQSTYGRAFLSIREDEIAAEAMGVNTTRYKVWAFVIAAFFAGVAGGLFGHTLGVGLSAESAGFQKSFDIIIMVVLGGLGSISGALIAAAVVTFLPELLRMGVELRTMGLFCAGCLVVWGVVAMVIRRLAAKRPGTGLGLVILLGGVGLGCFAIIAPHIGSSWLSGLSGSKLDLSPYRLIIYALALILIMIFRPKGLFGVHEVWERASWTWLPWLRKTRRASAEGGPA